MDSIDPDLQRLLAELTARGLATSGQLQATLRKSQPTVSRLLATASAQVLALGRGRATRYGVAQPIMGRAAQQPLWWVDEAGQPQRLGTLSLLRADVLHLQGPGFEIVTRGQLPWLLQPLVPQGFLGRLLAQRLSSTGLGANPELWGLHDTLFAALSLTDAPGAIVLGEPAAAPPLPVLKAGQLAQDLDALAADVAATLPAGSFAGGEQPKFLAQDAEGTPLLVKFSPPRGTPFGERWHDLLHAEALVSQVLAQHGVDVAKCRVIKTPSRSHLLSTRFDRVGPRGRRHVVALAALHQAFVPGRWSHWAASASALAQQGKLTPQAAAQAEALLHFGRLIGNSDMHAGNLSLRVDPLHLARPRFTLAPVYDMLPMRWRPDPQLGGAPDYDPFEPDPVALASPARAVAALFWARLAEEVAVSSGLRQTAGAMAHRLR